VNFRLALITAGFAALATAVAVAQTAPNGAASPPAPPLPNTVNRTPKPVTPVAAPSPAASGVPSPAASGRKGRGPSDNASPGPNASPSETPIPPQFTSLDGTWEVQLQPPKADVVYSHFDLRQTGNDLSGMWLRDGKTKLPLTGTFDGRLFKFALKDAAGKEYTMSGYEENFGDMVGILDDGKSRVAFTASHRKKLKFSDQAPGIGLPGVGR